jgi:ABC-type Fe3+-hydroxamate transport system substrate-binding protein
LEIARAIGVDVDDVFVGVSSYAIANDQYWPELADKVSITYGSPDYEQLAQMEPDLIILYKNPKKDVCV